MTVGIRNDGGYRDAVASAEEQVRKLEEDLRSLPPRPISVGLVWGAVVSVILALITSALAFTLLRLSFAPKPPQAASPTESLAVVPPKHYVRLYWPTMIDPIFADVNDDTTTDLVVLLWDEAYPETSLRVAALDGKTFAPIWVAGAWPGSWPSYAVHLEQIGDLVVVSDSHGGIHSMRLKTGERAGDFNVGATPRELSICPLKEGQGNDRAPSSSSKLVVAVEKKTLIFDLEANKESTEDAGAVHCNWSMQIGARRRTPECTREKGPFPCTTKEPLPPSPHLSFFSTIEDRDLVVSIGTEQDTPAIKRELAERSPPYAVVRLRGEKKPLWEGPAVAKGDKVHVGGDRFHYADEAIYVTYTALDGSMRLAARDARTGGELFVKELSDRGAVVPSVEVVDGRLYVRSTSDIRTFDPKTGAPGPKIDRVLLPRLSHVSGE